MKGDKAMFNELEVSYRITDLSNVQARGKKLEATRLQLKMLMSKLSDKKDHPRKKQVISGRSVQFGKAKDQSTLHYPLLSYNSKKKLIHAVLQRNVGDSISGMGVLSRLTLPRVFLLLRFFNGPT